MGKKKSFLIAMFIFIALVVIGACVAIHLTNESKTKIDGNMEPLSYYTDLTIQDFLENEEYKSLNNTQKYDYVLNELNTLVSSGEIIDSSIIYDGESQSFWFEYADHSEGVITLNDFSDEYDGGSDEVYQKENSDNNNRPNILAPKLNAKGYPYNESNLNALIIDCLSDADASLDFYEEREQWTAAHLKTDIITNISVEQFKTALRGYKFVNIRCHGNFQKSTGNQSNICLTEKITKEKNKKYKEDLKEKTIFKANGKEYWIHPKFFAKYYYSDAGLFDSIIWVGCCNGYQNDTLVSQLCNCGAKSVIGSTETVLRIYGTYMSEAFVFNLLCGDTVQIALEKAKNIWGKNDRIFYQSKSGSSTAEFRYYNGGTTTLVTLISDNIVVELPDTKDIFYRYIKSDLVPVYGLSELRVNQINYAEKPNYDGIKGIISAYINGFDSQSYLITIRFDNQAEKPHLIFEMYQYINNEVVKIDTFDNELDEYTLGFNAGLSDNYLCFYDYRHFNYASSSYGLHYYILKVTKSGFEKTFNLCSSHAAGGVNWIHNLFMDDKSYFETSDGSGDGLSEAVEAIKNDLKSIGFNNYEIKCDTDPESFVFNIKYDENIMSCSLYEQDITDYTDLRSHLNSNDEIDFDIIKEGRYENDIIKVDVKGALNEEGKIRIEYNLDNSHVSVANYEGTLKETLEFKASDWFGENSYSIVFDNESLHIVIQENPAWDQAAAISLPKADAELNYTTSDIPNYDISSWSDEMIIQAINQYLKSTEKWNKYAAFDIDLNDKRAFLRYQGGSEANTLTNLIVIWGIHEDYAQLAQYQSDSFGEIFHLTEYIDEPSSNKYYTEPLIEVYTASPWANGLTYILHMEGDFLSYSYILYTNESSNELVYTSSGSSDQTTIELCSSSTVSKVKVLITPYNKDNKPEQTIQIEADDSNLISISPINSVDKRGIINANGGVVAGYNKTYVVYNGKSSEKIRESLGDGWHITAIAEYKKDGITWYNLYDTDDHDYYGWVDSKYIDFN